MALARCRHRLAPGAAGRARAPPGGGGGRGRAWVFAFVTVAWIFFRADTLEGAFRVIGRLFTGWTTPTVGVTWQLVTLIFVGVAIQYVPRRVTAAVESGFSRLGPVVQGLAVAVLLFLIGAFGPQGPALFLYFKF